MIIDDVKKNTKLRLHKTGKVVYINSLVYNCICMLQYSSRPLIVTQVI